MSLSLADNVIVAGADNYPLCLTSLNIVLGQVACYSTSKVRKMEKESNLYDEFDMFTSVPGEIIHSYYLRFAQLINDMHTIRMTRKPIQVNKKFINHIQLEWIKFATDVKLAKDLHNTSLTICSGGRSNATAIGVNKTRGTNTTCQAKVICCYNCQEEGHMARQCTKPKRSRNLAWFKEKEIPTPSAFQTNNLDPFDSNCDEAPSASSVLMAKLSSYDSKVLLE
ncbi:retrovirus-related pol polyprotein from transposon TNT 1-94, partial [Tanacetum coccineum]